MTYRVTLSPEFIARVLEDAQFIERESSIAQADAWVARIRAATTSLSRMPRRCRVAEESTYFQMEVRSLIVDGYMILFTIDDAHAAVNVFSARHGRQRPLKPRPKHP